VKTRAGLAFWVVVAGLLLLLPPVASASGYEFYVGVATRVLAYAIAVSSLNFVLGQGGMLSLAQGSLLGVGGYTVAILSVEATRDITFLPGATSAWITWPLAMLVGAVLAVAIASISLRTRAIFFLMITLAFNQMLYYLFFSMKAYGGDDGLNMAARSEFLPGIGLESEIVFFYVTVAVFAAFIFTQHRLAHSRFGRVLDGIRINETRMEALGYDTYRYKLVCFAIGGAGSALAGAILANKNTFVSPALLDWLQSGTLLVMAILGGVGQLWGGLLGAAVYLLIEELLSAYTQRWQIGLGVALIAVTLYAPRGLAGLLAPRARR
jgi:branched-chain amino acid transport system permease protein